MKAYKATNQDSRCINLKYELGKVYTFEGELKICEQGFHFCKEMSDIFHCYPPDSLIYEIEVLGDILDRGPKSVTNKFRLVCLVDYPDRTFDANGNLTYFKDPCGQEYFYAYDSNGNLIYKRYGTGYEYFYSYDSNGNMICQKDSQGDQYSVKIEDYVEV
jgi:YD repeat-containing protein